MAHPNSEVPKTLYPTFTIDLIRNPSRLYAIPVIGGLTKIVILSPIIIELFFLGIVISILLILNSFVVLFTGRYWTRAYDLIVGVIKLNTKVSLFFYGLTNQYPGFSFAIDDAFSIDMAKPTKPARFFAIPVIGGLVRIVLLIPFGIFSNIIQYGAMIASLLASIPVLMQGKYPESFYELVRDTIRINQSIVAYMCGLSDTYPSFWISMNHKNIKIILILAGAILFVGNYYNKFQMTTQHRKSFRSIKYAVPSPTLQHSYTY